MLKQDYGADGLLVAGAATLRLVKGKMKSLERENKSVKEVKPVMDAPFWLIQSLIGKLMIV